MKIKECLEYVGEANVWQVLGGLVLANMLLFVTAALIGGCLR